MRNIEEYKISFKNKDGYKFVNIKDVLPCDDMVLNIRRDKKFNTLDAIHGHTFLHCSTWVNYNKKYYLEIVHCAGRRDFYVEDYDNNVYYLKTLKDAIRIAKAIIKCNELNLTITESPENKVNHVFEHELPIFIGYRHYRENHGCKYKYVPNIK